MGRARQGEPHTATLSPSSAQRPSLYAFRCLARFANADVPRIVGPERLAAAHAIPPPDMADDAGRVVVNIQHCLAPRATIIGPRQRFNEPVAVTLGPLCRRYSADGFRSAATPLARWLLALCWRRWAALAVSCQPRRDDLGTAHPLCSHIRSRRHAPQAPSRFQRSMQAMTTGMSLRHSLPASMSVCTWSANAAIEP